MRVLWLTNMPMPAVGRHCGISLPVTGHWMSALLDALREKTDYEFAVATAYPGFPRDLHFSEEGIDYFVIAQPKRVHVFDDRKQDLARVKEVVRRWKPDVIHVHGTERFLGLVSADQSITTPVVVSIQGLVSECLKKYFGQLSIPEILQAQSLRGWLRFRGFLFDYFFYRLSGRREKEIIRHTKHIAGRTLWDRAHALAIHPGSVYHHLGELLRPEFYRERWRLDQADRYSIIFTNARNPYKGAEIILDAIGVLSREFPSVRLRLAGVHGKGAGYGRVLRKRIQALELESRVDFLGHLNSEEMARALSASHVFCIASFVENSSNSLCEAQLLGMPCVASYAGGIPRLVKDGETGLLFPPGDAEVLAEQIRRIFLDDGMAQELGRKARTEAVARHDPDKIVKDCAAIYEEISVTPQS